MKREARGRVAGRWQSRARTGSLQKAGPGPHPPARRVPVPRSLCTYLLAPAPCAPRCGGCGRPACQLRRSCCSPHGSSVPGAAVRAAESNRPLFLSLLLTFLSDRPGAPRAFFPGGGPGRGVSSCQTAHCLGWRGQAHGKSCPHAEGRHTTESTGLATAQPACSPARHVCQGPGGPTDWGTGLPGVQGTSTCQRLAWGHPAAPGSEAAPLLHPGPAGPPHCAAGWGKLATGPISDCFLRDLRERESAWRCRPLPNAGVASPAGPVPFGDLCPGSFSRADASLCQGKGRANGAGERARLPLLRHSVDSQAGPGSIGWWFRRSCWLGRRALCRLGASVAGGAVRRPWARWLAPPRSC